MRRTRRRIGRLHALVPALALLTAASRAGDGPGMSPAAPVPPPVAKVAPRATVLQGELRVDPYHWLRDKTSPAVVDYLKAENAHTEAFMRPLKPLEDALYAEILGRIKQTDLDVPYRDRGYFYYSRTVEGEQYPIYARRKGSEDAPEQVLIDGNELAKGRKFLSVGPRAVSPDGRLLAYATDVTGYREYTLVVKDLDAGTLLPDTVPKVTSVAWSADGKVLFYGTEDAAKRPYRVYRHALGTDPKGDALVYEEKDELFRAYVAGTRDRKLVMIHSSSSDADEQRSLPADRPEAEPRVILPREKGHEYRAEHRDGTFYIRTNKGEGNREFRLVTAPAADPRPESWKELVPARPGITLKDLDVFKDFAVVAGVDRGLPFLEVLDLEAGGSHRVPFPEPAYSVFGDLNPEYDTTVFRYRYQSMITPASVYDYDMRARTATLRKRTEVLGGYDPSKYASERIFATAADGAKVPIALVYRKTTPRDGSAPLLLYGYGAYGADTPITFSSANLSLLDRGMVYAVAQVRGGGDLGKAWHDRGKMLAKRNTFTDFIACAEHLITEKFTGRDRLAIRGGSAGGLLIGAACNFRPDLCKVAVLEVPFVDVINTMSDPSLPLTIQEYLEWGNPAEPVEYAYMRSYSPYDNIRAADYPAMLVRTSLNDSQVPYWEPAKYVARMRATRTDRNPLLLKTNMDAGHGGASGRYDAIREAAFLDAFLLDQLGLAKRP
ncbi:Protease 2 [Aquisphaera giovannonii]|uniref:Protease 2 n=1 Tax=Aquisphaera giovannonii TaxID=406548 RepID=A0A5B9VVP7_9BACT|nr:S9 family peptidase [Aquisphaera giovannonii]QEH31790.1 Protease 2 [Aquisphaera giovannonii]